MTRKDARFAAYVPYLAGPRTRARAVVAEATADDVPALAALQARARGGEAEEWAERISRARSAERSLVITAKVSGEAVGYANAAFLPEHPVDHAPAGYYLTGVTVDPAWRRRGIAKLLTLRRMDWVRGRARLFGVSSPPGTVPRSTCTGSSDSLPWRAVLRSTASSSTTGMGGFCVRTRRDRDAARPPSGRRRQFDERP
ncbi:GNAT family N-acetyltransferase [Streptomyces sp. NPDC050422]|uniref:GNAT family N-acetyltransferase n=1 Tax=Streptomyces sp. NPDC050422 TaxID=3365614 RepID=UPI00378B83BA